MKDHVKDRFGTASIYLGSAFSVAGVQAVGPGLPNLQNHFQLSNSHTLWAISFYLFPGILFAVPLGKLPDRVGRMKTYGFCLLVFGCSSLITPLAGFSWQLFLAIRVLQGTAFAGIFPLSIILVAQHGKGSSVLKRQGLRSVSQQVADTVNPLIGGLLVAAAWYAPYLVGITTLPVAAVVFFLGFDEDYRSNKKDKAAEKLKIIGNLPLISIIFGGFFRFFIKFVPLSSLGIMLVNQRGFSTVFAGFALALSSFVGIFGALSVGKVSKYLSPFAISVSTLVFLSLSLIALSITGNVVAILIAVSVFGIADGLFGTVQNSYVSIAVPNHLRGTFSGIVAMSRNVGKFLAPIVMGLILATASISTAFAVSGVIAALGLLLMPPLRHFNKQLSQSIS